VAVLLFLLIALLVFWTVAPIVLLAQGRRLRAQVAALERRLDAIDFAPAAAFIAEAQAAAVAAEPEAAAASAAPPVRYETVRAPANAEPDEDWAEPPRGASLGARFEGLVGGRMLIWVGAAALVLAAVFLIRHSIEIGLVTPGMRMAAAALFGFALLGAGEYARRGKLGEDPRVAQALVGAGLAILYATIYGSHSLYGMFGAGTASAAMAALTLAALLLSLRHGPATAAVGLAGGFLMPLLVGDPDGGAVPLLVYLAFLNAAVFAVALRAGRLWLAAAATLASFAWTFALLGWGDAGDARAAGLFVLLLAGVAALVSPARGATEEGGAARPLTSVQPLAIGLLQLALLVGRGDSGLIDWALFGALAAASLALAVLRADFRHAPPLALALLLVLIARHGASDPGAAAWAAALATVAFAATGMFEALRGRHALVWTATAAAALALPALTLRAVAGGLLVPAGWTAVLAGLALAAAWLAARQAHRAREVGPADLVLMLPAAAALPLAGAALHDLLGPSWSAAAWAVLALAPGLAARRLRDEGLSLLALGTALVVAAAGLWMVAELSVALLVAAAGEPVMASDLPSLATAARALLLPAAAFAALYAVLPDLGLAGRRALPLAASLFGAAALYVAVKHGFAINSREDFAARGMAERTLLTQLLFLLGWAAAEAPRRLPRLPEAPLRAAAAWLTGIAALRFAWFDLFAHNPAWQTQHVGDLPVLNLILPAYLASALWLYAARRRAAAPAPQALWLGLALAALGAGALLLVRQAFQGPILTAPGASIAEFYTYSAAGLALALGLLFAGIRLPDKALRIAGLAALTATAIKVFGFDADALDGVLRILSFMGLGVALIAIGRLYAAILKAERATS
jgi:uncharacterized membrane protein